MPNQSLKEIKVSEKFRLAGYVLDEEKFDRIDSIAKQAVEETLQNKDSISTHYEIITSNNIDLSFDDKKSLSQYLEEKQPKIHAIGMYCRNLGVSAISMDFNPQGKISISAYGTSLDFQFNVENLINEIKKCEPEYNWFERKLVLRDTARFFVGFALTACSVILVGSIIWYFYVLSTGVDINPDIILTGDDYYSKLEHAIKSDNTNEKLDILLKSQLKNFSPTAGILSNTRTTIALSSIFSIILLVIFLLLKKFEYLYPLSFLALGAQKNELAKIDKKRQFWGTVIIIGFMVNILAGVAIVLTSLISLR